MSSMFIEAMTCRSCPKMMSSDRFLISIGERPRRRMAAFCICSGVVPTATVNTLGTFTRMFSIESAPRSGISICIGSRLSMADSWINGQTNFAPPWMQVAASWPLPVLP